MRTCCGILSLAAACAAAAGAAPAGVPLGHKDFYPSAQRPVGWRGDGTGAFPGAAPVRQWSEGTLKQVLLTRTVRGKETKRRFSVFADDRRKNIVWKTEMPGYSNSQPIVVGRRVFATADPSFLVCADADTGKILWQADLNPFEAQQLPKETAEKLTVLSDICYGVHGITASLLGNYHRLSCHRVERMTKAYLGGRLSAIRGVLDRAAALGLACGVDRSQQHLAEAVGVVEAMKADEAGQEDAAALSRAIKAIPQPIRDELRKQHGVLAYTHFDGWTGFTWPAPASDGRHVFVSMGQGQVACYDLAGRRVWIRHFRYPERGKLHKLTESASPLLLGEVLVVQKYDRLAGLSKRTGEVLWELPEGDPGGGQSHAAATLANGTRVVATTGGKIVRAADGKVLADLGRRQITGPSLIAWDNVVYMSNSAGGDGPQGVPIALRLVPDGPDRVKAEVLWQREKEAFGVHGRRSTDIYHAGRIYRPNRRDPTVVDARTGEVLAEKLPGFAAGEGPSPILAGGCLITTSGGGCPYIDGSLRWWGGEGLVVHDFSVVVLEGGLKAAPAETSFLGGRNKPRMPRLEKYLPQLYQEGLWSTSGATPIHFGDGSFFAHGNRLFLLSTSHLYCLGDPGVPFDGRAAPRPAEE